MKSKHTTNNKLRKLKEKRKTLKRVKGGENTENAANVIPQFGVELEMCVKLDKACTGQNIILEPRVLNNTKSKMIGLEGKYYGENKIQWIDQFKAYADNYLKSNPVTPKMRDKYGYVYVRGYNKYGYDYIYDLTTFELKEQTGKIDYLRPFFNTDYILCGDNLKGNNLKKYPELSNTFSMEFITPILSSLDDLKLLFQFIGLDKKGCFITNKTTGYHVNMSLLDKESKKPIKLTKKYFTDYFYPRFKEWEKYWYPYIREEKTYHAQPLYNMRENQSDNTSAIVEDINVIYNTIKDSKEYTISIKSDSLYEVRAFGASAYDKKSQKSKKFTENPDMHTLLEYTNQSIKMLKRSYDKMISNETN